MASDIKQYETAHRKIKAFSKDEFKTAEDTVKAIKYFRYDMLVGLEDLEEKVLELKTDDPFKPKKIDYWGDGNKDVRAMLKDVRFNHKKVVGAIKDLTKVLPTSGIVSARLKKLKTLNDEITKDLKVLKKDKRGDKSIKVIENLQKQISTDEDICRDFLKLIKEMPRDYTDAGKILDKRIAIIMAAKPRLSSNTQKFRKLEKKFLTKNNLQNALKDCKKQFEDVKNSVELAVQFVEENKAKDGVKHWKDGESKNKKLLKTIKIYTDIEKKFSSELDKSKGDKKVIEKAFKAFKELKDNSEEYMKEAQTRV